MGLPRPLSIAAAAFAALALSACGEEQREDTTPLLSSPRVAITADYPGYAPFALITYSDAKGRRCHSLASVTADGPRVMGELAKTLAEGLAKRGTCLREQGRDVSLQVRGGNGTPRVLGGIVRPGITRVVVAGQTVRPRKNGEFLVVHPANAGAIGNEIELVYTAGHHRRLPLRLVAS